MAVDSSEKGQDGYSISPWPEEDGMDVGRVSPLEDLSLLDVEDPIKDQMSSNTRLDCEDFLDFEVESLDAYTPCIVDVDIEKENYEMNMKRVLRGHVSLKTGQKLMRLLIDNSTMLLKFTSKEWLCIHAQLVIPIPTVLIGKLLQLGHLVRCTILG
ncbi:hypothetical protein SAY86_031737 [Trapa natans]|uniref:Uncharacterized protein n=1 Tax=Trapa natans TaxID=22666 RepID=A0AAN7LUQ3_TRANT|nr:hypothetical protein SAY86_031737 [Trapa natans]